MEKTAVKSVLPVNLTAADFHYSDYDMTLDNKTSSLDYTTNIFREYVPRARSSRPRSLIELGGFKIMSDLWKGEGAWTGWKLNTDHASSSYGQLVLVSPDSIAYDPGDIISLNDVYSGPDAAAKWGVDESILRDYAAQGRFYPSEIKHLNRDWIITRQGMQRLFDKALE